jgi:hypothetical protein
MIWSAAILVAAGAVAVAPASAGGGYGVWTYHGGGRMWHGTFHDSVRVTGFAIGDGGNSVKSFTIGGVKAAAGTGSVLNFKYTPGKQLRYRVTFAKPVPASQIDVCVQFHHARFKCRF